MILEKIVCLGFFAIVAPIAGGITRWNRNLAHILTWQKLGNRLCIDTWVLSATLVLFQESKYHLKGIVKGNFL